MDCKITSTNTRRKRSAFTLAEMMIAVGIGSMAMAAVASLVFYTARSYAAMTNYVDLDQYSRRALDRMSQEIRQADELAAFTTNRLEFVYNGSPLVYAFNSSARTLTRTYGGQTEILLKECDKLTFSVFQRNPVGGSYDQYPAATPTTAKLVQLTWTCSRKILGEAVNTESVQSAKIVIRKQE
jgi:prepilin-type N-terminal cleavage/methylation domain-containing protein